MPKSTNPKAKEIIIGGGILGLLEAYFAYLESLELSEPIRITIYDKNDDITQTTTYNIAPSLTPDELLSVVPIGEALQIALNAPFDQPQGIRVDDVVDVKNSETGKRFIAEVKACFEVIGNAGHAEREAVLLAMGKLSMQLWQSIYENADAELNAIFKAANFNSGVETYNHATKELHNGYRIDLIYDVPNANLRTEGMKKLYTSLGYDKCEILTPDDVANLDPSLTTFCELQSTCKDSKRIWKTTASAIWRPGGCINATKFIPLFCEYLEKKMGTYINKDGKEKNTFRLKFKRTVDGVVYASKNNLLNGLHFKERSQPKINEHYEKTNYVFTPGENVGTLERVGFKEPAYARFAGPSLKLVIDIPEAFREKYKNFNHCMEVHKEGVVLAWQGRMGEDGKIYIAVAGTKAFYADVEPKVDEAFAKFRHILQLNVIKDVFPDLISHALGEPVQNKTLTETELVKLENKCVAKRWVGSRAVAADNVPNTGALYNDKGKIPNARATTSAGSGGVSFGPVLVAASREIHKKQLREPSVVSTFSCLFTTKANEMLMKAKEFTNTTRQYTSTNYR